MLFDITQYQPPENPKFKSYIEKFKHENNYRHIGGGGWKKCITCEHSIWKSFGTAKGTQTKLKCTKLGTSNSNKTDISRYCVCDLYKNQYENKEER